MPLWIWIKADVLLGINFNGHLDQCNTVLILISWQKWLVQTFVVFHKRQYYTLYHKNTDYNRHDLYFIGTVVNNSVHDSNFVGYIRELMKIILLANWLIFPSLNMVTFSIKSLFKQQKCGMIRIASLDSNNVSATSEDEIFRRQSNRTVIEMDVLIQTILI